MPHAIILMDDLPKITRTHMLAGTTMMVLGGAGIGKTSFFRDYAYAQGADFFYGTLNASTAMLGDIIGFLLPHDETFMVDGKPRSVAVGKFTYPFFMRDERTGMPAFLYKRGLLVIDEYDKASPEVKKALAILQEEGRLGEHRLPPGIQIVVLGNRQKDRSGSTKDFDFIINRRGQYELKPSLNSWIVWAQGAGMSIETMAFVAANPETVFSTDVPDDQGPWPTPRSVEKLDRWAAAAVQEGIVVDANIGEGEGMNLLWMQGAMAHVGAGMAAQMLGFRRLQHRLPRYSAIISDPKGTPVPEEPDAMMLIAYQLAHKVDKKELPAASVYLRRMPKPFAVSFWRVLTNRDHSFVSTPTMGEWLRENSTLMEVIVS